MSMKMDAWNRQFEDESPEYKSEKKPMTPQEALLLPAGRELDEWIGSGVFGETYCWTGQALPRLVSSDINSAFTLEQELFGRGLCLGITRMNLGNWVCSFSKYNQDRNNYDVLVLAHAPTAPLAICRAAIQVLIYEMEHTND